MEEFPTLNIKTLGTPPSWIYDLMSVFKGRVSVRHKWDEVFDYPKTMAKSGEILLIPLLNNEFNRIGKSDIKFLEATMTGKTCVASPVGIYKSTIKHGKNGFLAETEEDWIKYISLLLKNEKLRKKLHRSAVEYIAEKRLYNHNLSLWYEAYKFAYFKALPRKKLAMEIASARAAAAPKIIIPR